MRTLLLAISLAVPVLAPAADGEIRVVNEAALPPAQLDALLAMARPWAARVYAYTHVEHPPPVTLLVSRRVRIGYYTRPTVYLPVADADEMLETWVHELTHHATGHESSFFFKEGIATHTLEALLAQEQRVPEGFPNYGQGSDAWVRLFLQRGELQALAVPLGMQGYAGDSREGDFRSWQAYLVGASFVGWLIRNQGYEAFAAAFARQGLGDQADAWERRWRADLLKQREANFDPAQFLPQRPRYRYYVERLQPKAG